MGPTVTVVGLIGLYEPSRRREDNAFLPAVSLVSLLQDKGRDTRPCALCPLRGAGTTWDAEPCDMRPSVTRSGGSVFATQEIGLRVKTYCELLKGLRQSVGPARLTTAVEARRHVTAGRIGAEHTSIVHLSWSDPDE
jgi:hypothetical protein